jgi:hypothetical protein
MGVLAAGVASTAEVVFSAVSARIPLAVVVQV